MHSSIAISFPCDELWPGRGRRRYCERRIHETGEGREKIGLISSKNRNATGERREGGRGWMVVITRPGKYRRAVVLRIPFLLLLLLSSLFRITEQRATPSRNVTRSYRPTPPTPLSFFLSARFWPTPFTLLSPHFGISRATVFQPASLSLPASIRLAAARKCNKRCRVFTRAVKWYSVSYCRRTSILVFEA